MNKGTLWIFFILIIAYFMLMFCVTTEAAANNNSNLSKNSTRTSINTTTDLTINRQFNLEEEARKRHGIYHRHWWWHALAIAYWVKVKVIIVGFFVGSAIFLGLRYFWPHKCHGEVYRESPVIYDHPPSFSHDHSFSSSPYSSSFDTTNFGTSGGGDIVSGDGGSGPYTYGIGSSGSDGPHIKRRSIKKLRAQRDLRMQLRNGQRQKVEVPQLHTPTEEQIGDMMFYFLGLDSKACKRRFICEMEFRSRLHPLTSMAFRIIGRSFFGKYTNERNEGGQAKSFDECAAVNAECVFIEQGQEGEQEEDAETATEQPATEGAENSIENELSAEAAIANNEMEQQNVANIKAERRIRRQHHTGGDLVAQRIWARAN